MADWVKIAVKAGLVITATALVIVLLTTVTFPALDLSVFIQGIQVGKAVANYWFPYMGTLFSIFTGLLLLELVSMTAYVALIAIRWILKVNE